jgi:hypothetical protein
MDTLANFFLANRISRPERQKKIANRISRPECIALIPVVGIGLMQPNWAGLVESRVVIMCALVGARL